MRVPPEILGRIFIWRAFRERNHPLGGLQKGPYSFLLVCYHWFEVTSHIPELWSFWGNILRNWSKRYRHPGVAPLDLVLDGWADNSEVCFHGPLQDAVRNSATRDKIRQIYIRNCDPKLLTSIISSLAPDGVQEKCIESIILQPRGSPTTITRLADFFVRVSLPKLRHLDIVGAFQTSL